MKKTKYVVITTISSDDTYMVGKLIGFLENNDITAIIVGDKKTPEWKSHPNIDYLSVEDQELFWPKLAQRTPYNHYSRKNFGYLRAVSLGAQSILDTDDDNFPTSDPWQIELDSYRIISKQDWINVYRYFGEQYLWPRGLPLSKANEKLEIPLESKNLKEISCFQSLVDGDPDIDAIGRMLFPSSVTFQESTPILLANGICPTNSQATIWKSWCLPLLYLPSYVPFRLTDIWRGLIAQPAIRALGGNTFFGKLGFYQFRNPHDLKKDFQSEISGHLFSELVLEVSEEVWKNSFYTRDSLSIIDGIKKVYSQLVEHNVVNSNELQVLDAWCKSVIEINPKLMN